jgi:hypothetical protein
MKSLQLVFSMKKLFIAALTAASLLSCPPAAFSQPVTKLEVIQRENGLVLCNTKDPDRAIALLRVDGTLQCVEIGIINFKDLPLADWLNGSQLMRRDP